MNNSKNNSSAPIELAIYLIHNKSTRNMYIKQHIANLIYRAACSCYPQIIQINHQLPLTIEGSLHYAKGSMKHEVSFQVSHLSQVVGANISARDLSLSFKRMLSNSSDPIVMKAKHSGQFLNIYLQPTYLAEILSDKTFLEPFSVNGEVIVEYSQPNTHKIFHVGHMRNVALGDSLSRILRYSGKKVHQVNYIGDVGTHIAKCLWYYIYIVLGSNVQDYRFDLMTLQNNRPSHMSNIEWFGEMYQKAHDIVIDTHNNQYREVLSHLEESIGNIGRDAFIDENGFEPNGEYNEELEISNEGGGINKDEITKLWKITREQSLESFKEIYQWIGCTFDHYFSESDVAAESKEMVYRAHKDGSLTTSGGTIGADLSALNLGYCMLLTSDHSGLYATKDLCLAKHKFDKYPNAEKSIHVVDSSQSYHFKQVFATLNLLGFKNSSDCIHIPYGLVKLPNGKMSSRKGNIIPFSKLKDSLSQKLRLITPTSTEETIRKLSVATIRYGMLNQENNKDIVFDVESWTDFKGNTGIYLLYTYTRIRKILAEVLCTHEADYSKLVLVQERKILLSMRLFQDAVCRAAKAYKPQIVCTYLHCFCKEINKFYQQVKISTNSNESLKRARLDLLGGAGKVLGCGLGLLGIETVESM